MTVEEARASRGVSFPVGMRVLAVDDDPVCLRLLETLLLRCQYNVMTTDKATTALQLLRENKDRFDLVISDVHMPDMDGFKLLELVGLEMDLPVIMLSGNGETQTVMKGITHGACDYLLKPVRIEELRNIWQHVIRRRKFEKRWNNDLDSKKNGVKVQIADPEDSQGKADHIGKVNKKRKDQNEEEDDDDSEDNNMQESEDSSFQKKPRVVWSVELHRKFVAAVNQLGIDRGVPKKILDLMNVEGITRENVASHLQKYRLYLKRLTAVASQQASMAAAAGGRGSSYLHMASLNGLRSYQAMGGQRQLATLDSLQMKGVLGRMNSPSSLGIHSLLPSQTLNATNSYDDLEKIQGINLPNYHQRNSRQGLPATSQLEQFQKPTLVQETRNHLLPGGFSGSTIAANPQCSNSFPNVANSPLLLQQNTQQHNRSGEYSPFRMSSSEATSIDFQGVHQCPGMSGDIRGSTSSISTHVPTKVLGESPTMMTVTPHLDPGANKGIPNQACSLSGSRIFSPASVSINKSIQKWDYIFNSNEISSTSNSSLTNICIPDATGQPSENAVFDQKLDVSGIDQVDFEAPLLSPNCMMDDKSTSDSQLNFTGGYGTENSGLQTGLDSVGCSLEDIVHSMIKPEQDDTAFIDADIECDIYTLGACMRRISN